jgi:hypothetical protein
MRWMVRAHKAEDNAVRTPWSGSRMQTCLGGRPILWATTCIYQTCPGSGLGPTTRASLGDASSEKKEGKKDQPDLDKLCEQLVCILAQAQQI